MSKKNPSNWVFFLYFCLPPLVIFAIYLGYSHVQARIYQRQGIDISTVEVFFGFKPASQLAKP